MLAWLLVLSAMDARTAPVSHWSFRPPVRPAVPVVRDANTPIHALILAALAEKKLTLAPQADRETLLRRLSLDLTGLPPTIDEVDAALSHKSPHWYEKQVERLLASP